MIPYKTVWDFTNKAAETVLGQQGQRRTKWHFFHFKGQHISSAFGAQRKLKIILTLSKLWRSGRDRMAVGSNPDSPQECDLFKRQLVI